MIITKLKIHFLIPLVFFALYFSSYVRGKEAGFEDYARKDEVDIKDDGMPVGPIRSYSISILSISKDIFLSSMNGDIRGMAFISCLLAYQIFLFSQASTTSFGDLFASIQKSLDTIFITTWKIQIQ
ncbi:hypothetical protein MDAP_002322 [Mitosporidium daphniae]